MRLILSRKGFDSSAGGCPSPVFEDGSFVSLPIPEQGSPIRFGDITLSDINIGDLVTDLTGGRLRHGHGAHLDPDLIHESLPDRHASWRPLLGQTSSAQGHLRKQNVCAGDLFVFFGLFRPAERVRGRWQFVRGTRPFHAMWGWLQIGEIRRVDELGHGDLPWARYHPHCHRSGDSNNTLYIGPPKLSGKLTSVGRAGGGVFDRIEPERVLTDPDGAGPSMWRLPLCFHPKRRASPLSYHSAAERWSRHKGFCRLRAAGRGQEFVVNAEERPGMVEWVKAVLAKE